MTFSSETRIELARVIPVDRCCAVAELAGMFKAEGIPIDLQAAKPPISFRLAHPVLARKVYRLVKLIDDAATVTIVRDEERTRRRMYMAQITGGQAIVLDAIKETLTGDDGLPQKRCCMRAFLRGTFLCRGSVSAPSRQYHFEIVVDEEDTAMLIESCLNKLGQTGRVSQRKGAYMVYLKESESIVEVLSLMGAHQALLKLENIRIVKNMRNRVNRLVNCETANVDKTVNAALEQLEAIRFIDEVQGLAKLPKPLQTLARLRLDHPYASLRELGEAMIPKASKSSVNYRMRRLMEIARNLQASMEQRGRI